MGSLADKPEFRPVRYFDANALLTGGPDCPDNLPLQDLADRTLYLKQKGDASQEALQQHLLAPDPHQQYTSEQEVISIVDNRTAQSGFTKKTESNVWVKGQSGAVAALPATTGAVTLDLSQSNNFEGVLTGSIVLANPSVIPVGQSGVIRIVQGATPFAIAYGSYWKGASGVLPGLTQVAGAIDDLVYYVESASRILITSIGDTK